MICKLFKNQSGGDWNLALWTIPKVIAPIP